MDRMMLSADLTANAAGNRIPRKQREIQQGATHMELGFIGLGQMGSRMAVRLLDAGYSLTVFDRDEAALAKIVARGARRASSPAEVAAASETVLMSLPTPDIVRNVVFGPNSIKPGASA
jgi:3-hydroxyisobutyrate dehydrogenase-like beta-hydroxyacid dehydrogenase